MTTANDFPFLSSEVARFFDARNVEVVHGGRLNPLGNVERVIRFNCDSITFIGDRPDCSIVLLKDGKVRFEIWHPFFRLETEAQDLPADGNSTALVLGIAKLWQDRPANCRD